MNKSLNLLILILLVSNVPSFAIDECPIVPLPSKVIRNEGHLDIATLRQINISDRRLASVAYLLQNQILERTGLSVPLFLETRSGSAILLSMVADSDEEEGYSLSISPTKVEVKAATVHGVFNGVMSLLQLLSVAAVKGEGVPCWQIDDVPQMKWRGLMLDESRHFFGGEMVKKILDWMAFYKLNKFHWHLTDVPGWRIEIKTFPNLTLVGGIGNHTDQHATAEYYTQDEIREIVRYASERFIEVIPEIDMPGHAKAANRAYPEYSGGGSEKYPDFTFNPGKEETYGYLAKILREVDVLFPSKMIHLGGDEVHFGNEKWNTDRHVQSFMKKRNLTDLKAVEHYFIERMADTIVNLGSKVLGWDEIAGTRIPPDNAIIFWWRHNLPETLKQSIQNGYKVVLCPRIPMYFDFVQNEHHRVGRKWQNTYSDLKTVYSYSMDQYPDIINNKNRDQVAGIQANLWSEVIVTDARLEYMLFPRITALAEAAWTDPKNRDYGKFCQRLSTHETLFRKASLYFYDVDSPESTPEVVR